VIIRIRVKKAMRTSPAMMSSLREYLSAQTPAKRDMAICGKKPQIVEMVIMMPDWVVSVMYQMIAYCTRDEPNNDKVWLARNSVIFFFHPAN
jgi:hypothetical protein